MCLASVVRRQDAQRPWQHPRPEHTRGLEDLTVNVRRNSLRQLYPDLPRPRQMHLRVLQQGAPERGGYEPQDLGSIHLLGPDHIEEPIVQSSFRREPEPRARGSPEGHRDQYGLGLERFSSVEPERSLVTPEAPEQPPHGPHVPTWSPQVRWCLHHAGRNLRIEADTQPVVEPDAIDLPRVHRPNLPPHEPLERPPSVGA